MLSLFLIFGFSGFDKIAEDQSLYHNNLKFLKENIVFTYSEVVPNGKKNVLKVESKILTTIEEFYFDKTGKSFSDFVNFKIDHDYETELFVSRLIVKNSENQKNIEGYILNRIWISVVFINNKVPDKKILENKIIEETAKTFSSKNIDLSKLIVKKD